MTLREKIDCMQAFERGEYVEVRTDKTKSGIWGVAIDPLWDWNNNDYRIKPKPKQVIVEKWLCKSAWDNYFIIEGEKAFFKTGGYDRKQVKLLDTYEVEL